MTAALLATVLAACALLEPGAEIAPVARCRACHVRAGPGHPVGQAYAPAATRLASGLRSAAEVVKAGVFLPDGEVRCTTCHDGRSAAPHRLAIPAGADRGTRALCLACHALVR